MSLKEIHFYQAECDNCGETFKYDSTQFSGDAWYLYPRFHGWHVDRGNWYTPSKILCPKCKNPKVGDAE